MSSQAQKVIAYINAGNPVLAQMGQKVYPWPASDGIPYAEAVTILDIYHDLVTNKGYELPTTNDNIKKLTAAIRAKLGYTKAEGAGLRPTLVLRKIKETVNTTIGPELYQWVYPNRITAPEPKKGGGFLPSIIPGENDSNPIVDSLANIKWIMFFGLAGLVLLQTGILKKVSPN